jgi:hypothetical protein
MQVGDPKKAMVLALIAIIIICVGAFRVLSKGEELLAGSAAAQTSEPQVDVDLTLPAMLTLDPFSHPKLAEHSNQPAPPASESQSVASGGGATAPKSEIDVRGGFGPLQVEPPLPNAIDGSLPGSKPEEITGSGQQPEKEKKEILVSAIVRVDKPAVFLSVSGGPAQAFGIGDKPAPGIRIKDISETAVTFQVNRREISAQVGEKVTL